MKKATSVALRAGVAGIALLAVGGVTAFGVFGGGLPKQSAAYTLGKVSTGSITSTWSTTGTITRATTSAVAFSTPGTVSDVLVKPGDVVHAGAVLATLDPTQLQLSVAVAKAGLAQAQAQLDIDNAASSSSSSSSGSSGSTGSSASGTVAQLATLQAQLKTLQTKLALAEANAAKSSAAAKEAAQLKQQLLSAIVAALASPACASTFAYGTTPTPTPSVAPSPTASPSASPSPTASPSASPSSSTASPTASPTIPPTGPTPPTPSAVAACQALLMAAVATAQSGQTPGGGGGPTPTPTPSVSPTPSPTGSPNPTGTPTPTPTGTSTGSGNSASSGTQMSTAAGSGATSGLGGQSSETKIANDKANLVQAQQSLATAKQNLASATLTAPIDGHVGAVALASGQASGSKAITIIGTGSAIVTVNVPQNIRPLISNGESASVTVPGSGDALTGTVTNVNLLANTGTATTGNPVYATQITVDDPQSVLFSGGVAGVTVALGAVDGVLVVPGSAVTPTGIGTGTVQVPGTDPTTPRTVSVTTGATGQGHVQIVSGLADGDTVILANQNASVPANSFQRPGQTRTSASASATPGAQSGGIAGGPPAGGPPGP